MDHIASVWGRYTDLEVVTGTGCTVTTSEGEEYLDFTSGIGVVNTGHCHPKVVEAIQAQAARFLHAQVNIYRHDLLAPLAAALAEICPEGIDSFFMANSGAEAVEAAIKLAKQATGRPNVITFDGSFHGRTHLAMALTTSRTAVRQGYAPLPAGVHVAPYARTEDEVDGALDGLREILAGWSAPDETAAMIIEPVLGEGGYIPAPGAFLRGVEEICRAHDIVFVVDEVQTGFGRTGRMFAVEHHGVRPDVMVLAKGMASGFPMSAIGASRELMSRWPTGSHGGTYGGNPMGCAAALATIEVLRTDGVMEAATAHGVEIRRGIEALAAEDPGVTSVRGLGLMVGVELHDPTSGRPDAARVKAILEHCCRESRVLLLSAGRQENVVRWIPPVVVDQASVTQALEAFAKALAATR